MPRTSWLATAAFLVTLGLAVPALADCPAAGGGGDDSGVGGTGLGADDGIGGTGLGDEDSGIGGTGFGDEDSGIGGTGFGDEDSGIGGTGVLGTITGLDGLCVSGLEIQYGPEITVTLNGEPVTAENLAHGQVVWIIAHQKEGRLFAQRIAILSALVGRVAELDPRSRTLVVGGEVVEVPGAAIVFGRSGGELRIEPGAFVDVSGLRRPDGRIVASRIDAAPAGVGRSGSLQLDALLDGAEDVARLSVEGYPDREVSADRFRLGGVEVDVRGLRAAPSLAPRERLRVDGALRGGVLRADRVTPVRDVPVRPELPRPTPDVAPDPQPEVPAPVRPPEEPSPPTAPDRPDAGKTDRVEIDRTDRPSPPERPDVPDRPDVFIRPEVPIRPDRPVTVDREALR